MLLKQAIQLKPDQWALRSSLAELLMLSGSPSAARIEFEKALELNAPKQQLVPKLADAMIAAGAARAMIDKYHEVNLGDAKANALLQALVAEGHLALGDVQQAKRAVDEALTLDATSSRAKLIRARLLAGGRDLNGALSLLDTFSSDDPNRLEAKHLKAEVLWVGKGDINGAEALLKEILATRKDHLPAFTTYLSILALKGRFDEYAQVLDQLKVHHARTPAHYFFETRLHLARKNLNAASISAQELMRLAPDHPLSLQLAGAVAYENGMVRLAESRLGKAIQLDPVLVVSRQLMGRIHLQRGQPRLAIDIVKPTLDSPAPSAGSLAIAGEASIQLGQLDQAADYFLKASKLAPEDVTSRTALAMLSIRAGQSVAGIEKLESIGREDQAAFADLALLSVRLKRGETNEALKIADGLALKLPGSPLPSLLKGRIYLSLGDLVSARSAFESAQKIRQDDFQVIAALVDLDLLEHASTKALQRLDALLKADPANYRAHMLAAGVLQRAGASEDQIMGHLRNAVRLGAGELLPRIVTVEYLASLRKYEAAKTMAQDAVAAFPDDPDAMLSLGSVLAQTGDLQQAVLVLTRAAKLRPADGRTQLTLSEVHLAKRDERAALSTLMTAVELIPESPTLRAKLIGLSVRLSKQAEVLRTAKEMQRRAANLAAGWVLESELAEARRDYPAAIAAAQNALKKQDGASNAARLYGLYLAAGKGTEADKFGRTWLEARPRDVLFLRYLAERAMHQQNYPVAEGYFKQLAEINPRDAVALNNLAWSLVKVGRPEALTYANKAVALKPGDPAVLDTQAEAMVAAGHGREALEVRRRAVALDPANPIGRFKLAKLMAAQEAHDAARAELESLLAAHPTFQGRADAEALLRALR